jgi:uncharacterized protein DUF6625
MAGLKKIMITPYFGKFPEWMDKFEKPEGYEWLLDTDLEAFKKRLKEKLGIEYPSVYGTGKVWDYRCALGLLYEEEIKDFSFWGHMDFDMVWGDVNKFYPDSMLNQYDVISGHYSYVCGCFSLYRNSKEVNELFKESPSWKDKMLDPIASGWVEHEYSRTLEQSGLRYLYTFHQGNPWCIDKPNLVKENGKLFQDGNEIAFFHFRHFKYWPL